MEREELVRVESFSEVRAGMLVVVRELRCCGGEYRGMALRLEPERPWSERGWHCAPTEKCHRSALLDGWNGFGESAVNQGRVYRVVIPPAADEQREATTKPRKVKGAA